MPIRDAIIGILLIVLIGIGGLHVLNSRAATSANELQQAIDLVKNDREQVRITLEKLSRTQESEETRILDAAFSDLELSLDHLIESAENVAKKK